jgi:hypothetical protein
MIEGKEYVPATIAGRHFGYTKDYLLMLIKGGKIDGKKIGNRWYVHLPSAERFFTLAVTKREERRKRISEERKAELRQYAQVQNSGSVKTVSIKKQKRSASATVSHVRAALIETFVVVIVGLMLGVTGYVGTVQHTAAVSEGGEQSFLKYLATALYNFISPADEIHSVTVPVVGQRQSTPAQNADTLDTSAISAHIGTTTQTALIVAPDTVFTSTTVDSVRDSFSDEVHVATDPAHPDTGVVTPVFKNGNGEPYRFLMVPVNATSSPSP